MANNNELTVDLDPDEINKRDLERRQAQNRQYIANKGEGVHAANTKAYGNKALEEQRYKCTICDLTFRSNAKLLEHQERPAHLNKAVGIVRRTNGRGGSQNAVKNKKYWCETCQHAASTAKRLQIHLKARRHAKKLMDIELSAQAN